MAVHDLDHLMMIEIVNLFLESSVGVEVGIWCECAYARDEGEATRNHAKSCRGATGNLVT